VKLICLSLPRLSCRLEYSGNRSAVKKTEVDYEGSTAMHMTCLQKGQQRVSWLVIACTSILHCTYLIDRKDVPCYTRIPLKNALYVCWHVRVFKLYYWYFVNQQINSAAQCSHRQMFCEYVCWYTYMFRRSVNNSLTVKKYLIYRVSTDRWIESTCVFVCLCLSTLHGTISENTQAYSTVERPHWQMHCMFVCGFILLDIFWFCTGYNLPNKASAERWAICTVLI
jgi:hypothetical protein